MTVKETIIDLSDNYYNDNITAEYTIDEPTTEVFMNNLENPAVEVLVTPEIENLYYPCQEAIVQAPGAPELPGGCPESPKYSGNTINLQASPNGGTFPYIVKFWRKSAPGPYTQVGITKFPLSEGAAVTESIALTDPDIVGAIGDPLASFPTTDITGAITDLEVGTDPLDVGKIRVATTVYDSCPTGANTCISTCDVTLGCVAPTCNFTVL